MQPVRCKKCNKMLGELTPPYKLKCKRCGEWNDTRVVVDESVGGFKAGPDAFPDTGEFVRFHRAANGRLVPEWADDAKKNSG